MHSKKLSIIDVYFIVLLVLGITNHVVLIPLMLQAADRDSWMGIILTMVLNIGWVYILYVIMKRTKQQSIFLWFKDQYGAFIGWLFIAISTFYFFAMALMMLRETTTWINVTYLPQTPRTVVSLCIISFCVFLAYHGIRTIAIISGILLPTVWILGHFVAISNLEYKDYSLLTPLFVDGYMPMIRSMVIAAGGFMELLILVFIHHHAKRKISYATIVILALLLGGLTLGPLMGAIANFGPIPAKQARYPAYDQWMLVTITKYITHLDFLALYQWISGATIRISLFLFIVMEGLNIKKRSTRFIVLLILGLALSTISLIPKIDAHIELYLMGRYSFIYLIFIASFTLMILLFTMFKRKSKGGPPS
ncbi:spore germination protein [Paenibacillus sp. JCM 10914]|uniref:GerAB/ArcD/ProY family transporter n=1 Tax=Paenibacillus sp. JCM 10914 TaxID=1236974 RepID=UPI0003CC508E|nr:endospore germination permease [Paenibacillus sp. JCM 10914]GAE09190.1 sugar transport system [Paenibacillus sp. JCM 10914]